MDAYPLLSVHGFRPQRDSEAVQQSARALLAAAAVDEFIEKGALFGDDETRAGASRLELDGRERHRDGRAVDLHDVGVDDALVRHDVEVIGVETRGLAALPGAAHPLAPADPEVGLSQVLLPLTGGAAEPTGLGGRVGEGVEHTRGTLLKLPLDDESVVLGLALGHVVRPDSRS